MARIAKLALWLLAIALLIPSASRAQTAEGGTPTGPVNVWTFSTDSSNNLVVQDFASLASAMGSVVGQPLCLQYASPCPADSARTRRKYSLRGNGGKASEWRLELGDLVYPQGGMSLPLQAGFSGDKGTVQVVSSPGPWTVNLQRIPAVELRAGEGKKWKVDLNLDKAEAGGGCWIEVQCPARQ